VKIILWTTTVHDGREIVTQVHATVDSAYRSIKDNYAPDENFDIADADEQLKMIEHLYKQGTCVYIESHEVTLT
jgi:ABC-type ATPase involved in cell division